MRTLPAFHWLLLVLTLLLANACGESARNRQTLRQIERNWPQPPSPPVWPEHLEPAYHSALDSFLTQAQSALHSIRAERLSDHDQKRYRSLSRRIEHAYKTIRAQAENPALYNLPGHWKALLSQPSSSPSDKILLLKKQLPLSTAYYRAAQAKLSRPNPEYLNLAIRKHILGVAFLEGELREFIEMHAQDDDDKRALLLQLSEAKLAVKQYLAWCNSQHMNSAFTR